MNNDQTRDSRNSLRERLGSLKGEQQNIVALAVAALNMCLGADDVCPGCGASARRPSIFCQNPLGCKYWR